MTSSVRNGSFTTGLIDTSVETARYNVRIAINKDELEKIVASRSALSYKMHKMMFNQASVVAFFTKYCRICVAKGVTHLDDTSITQFEEFTSTTQPYGLDHFDLFHEIPLTLKKEVTTFVQQFRTVLNNEMMEVPQ